MHPPSDSGGRAALDYHAATKHSPISIRTNRHSLDWANQPMPFKVYEDLDPIELPRGLSPSSVPALDAIGGGIPSAERAPALADLAKLLYYSAGITKSYDHGGHKLYFRAAACTGALYHVDLYLVCGEIEGLEAGVYHFGAHDFSLRRLRAGDYRETVATASGRHPWIVDAPATLVFASTYWRNSWKYESRAYRHVGWDSGTMLANLLAVAAASELRAGVVAGFTDGPIETLLGLDPQWEGAAALVPIGQGAGPTPTPSETPPLDLKTAPLSRSMVDYPKIRELHAASSLVTPEEAAAWRGDPPPRHDPPPARTPVALKPLPSQENGEDGPRIIEEIIQRRGSPRAFSREPIDFEQLSVCLASADAPLAADFLGPAARPVNEMYVIANAVDGLEPGVYHYRREERALEPLMLGDFRDQAGFLGLEQDLPKDAAADVFFTVELERLTERFGDRAYRAAQLEAGVMGGRLYLAAYAQGFGASGLTFFDDETIDFLSPHAAGKSVTFLVALGKRAKRHAH